MTEKERYEKTLNIILKKQYPFFENIYVTRYKEVFSHLQVDVTITLGDDFISKHIDRTCYDQMDDFHLSNYSFEHCSDIKFNHKEFEMELKNYLIMTNTNLNMGKNTYIYIQIYFIEDLE